MSKTNIYTIPGLPGDKYDDLLDNPDRGFRLEAAMDVALNTHPFHKKFDGIGYLKYQYDYYKLDMPKLAQTYFYLSHYEDKDLDQIAFTNMQNFLDELKAMGLKALLRFAYETDFGGPKGARQEVIMKHMKQLAPFIEENKDVIHVYQAGFIGAWGEWHASKYNLDKKDILEGIIEMVPQDMQIQIRLPNYKNLIDKNSLFYRKIGFHDDFIVIKPHEWDGEINPENPQYKQIIEESSELLVDGELPWGTWSVEKDSWIIDGYDTLRRLVEHKYTSLSIVHNYRENGDEIKYSMKYWKESPISEEWLSKNNINFSSKFFYNQLGERINRSVFDFIKYHMGYCIQADSVELLDIQEDKVAIDICIKLFNFGFAAPLSLKSCEIVLLNENGAVIDQKDVKGWNMWLPNTLNSNGKGMLPHEIRAAFQLPHDFQVLKLGIRMENSTNEFIKLVNDIAFYKGINILMEIPQD